MTSCQDYCGWCDSIKRQTLSLSKHIRNLWASHFQTQHVILFCQTKQNVRGVFVAEKDWHLHENSWNANCADNLHICVGVPQHVHMGRFVCRFFPGECNYGPIYSPSFFYAAFIFSKVHLGWNEAWQWSLFMNTIKTQRNCLPYAPPCSGCPSKWLQIRENSSLVFLFDLGFHSKST